MKKLIALFTALVMIVSMCSCSNLRTLNSKKTEDPENTDYMIITEIDHCVVEPDDKLHMTDDDELNYQKLMDAMLNRKSKIVLSDDVSKNEFYIDLLKQSPYFYFLSECEIKGDTVHMDYAYSKSDQNKMLEFLDSKFLDIVNTHASSEDNTLDRILNIYGAVARLMTYDHVRTDNKQLDSPLFKYPDDEIYKALKNKESVCYGFAYTLRFALLQIGIDCFCVYGPCSAQGEGHMWNIFKYNGKFYTCDPAWDRAEDDYVKLYHFGKTDKEREADHLKRIGFSSKFYEEYGEVECTDTAFKIFRGIERYSFSRTHTYFMVDYEGEEYIFDTEKMELK